jgi:predicted ATP-dependent serine protease
MYDALVQFISTQETFFALGSSLYGREKNSFRPRAFPYSEVAFAYSEVADGIRGLDQISGGGLPKGRTTIICGGPGCGKTMLGIEFLVRGALDITSPAS